MLGIGVRVRFVSLMNINWLVLLFVVYAECCVWYVYVAVRTGIHCVQQQARARQAFIQRTERKPNAEMCGKCESNATSTRHSKNKQ